MGFQRSSVCGRPSEVLVSSIFQAYSNSFVKARLEGRVIKSLKKQMVWPQNGVLLASYSNLLFNLGFQRSFVCGRPSEVRVSSIFQAYSNSFVKACLEARVIKSLKRQMVWPQNGVLLASYSNLLFNLGFQRSSVCGRPSEVRVSSIFQAYSNSFVKARPDARGI